MFAVYLRVITEVSKVESVNIHVITPDPFLHDVFTKASAVSSVYLDEGKDLNELQELMLQKFRPRAIAIVMADLPLLTSTALESFLHQIEAVKPDMAIVPSHDSPPGTSILYLNDFRNFSLQYGMNSYWNHVKQASELNYLIYSCNNFQLSFDIDTWSDLVELGRYLDKITVRSCRCDGGESIEDFLNCLILSLRGHQRIDGDLKKNHGTK